MDNWYNKVPNATCRCQACLDKWDNYRKAHKHLPKSIPDNEWSKGYITFNTVNHNKMAATHRALIKRLNPEAAFILFHYTNTYDHIDGFTTESRTNYT